MEATEPTGANQRAPQAFENTVFLRDVIAEMHESLTAAHRAVLRQRLVMLFDATGGEMRVATGCSGSNVAIMVMHRLAEYWMELIVLQITTVHDYSVAIVQWKRAFIAKHNGPRHILADMHDVCNPSIDDAVIGLPVHVRAPHVWIAGIECDSVSSCSSLMHHPSAGVYTKVKAQREALHMTT